MRVVLTDSCEKRLANSQDCIDALRSLLAETLLLNSVNGEVKIVNLGTVNPHLYRISVIPDSARAGFEANQPYYSQVFPAIEETSIRTYRTSSKQEVDSLFSGLAEEIRNGSLSLKPRALAA